MSWMACSESRSGTTTAEDSTRKEFLAELERAPRPTDTRRTDAGQRPVEAALRGSYRALYDEIPLMCFTLDTSGLVLAVNSHGAALLGYQPEDLLGRSVLKVVHAGDRAAVMEQIRSAFAQSTTTSRRRSRKLRRDGSMLWAEETVRVVEENGRSVVLVVCQDITERVEVEDNLLRYQGQLRDLSSQLALAEERERRRIADGLHDQVGQFLAMAKLRLGALQGAGDPEARERQIGGIRTLLEQALKETRSLTFELSSPVLYSLGLEEACRDLAERLGDETGLRVRFETDSQPKQPLSEDTQVTLFRATQELLFNIAKHARARNVHLRVTRADNEIRITVEDDGTGFDHSRLGRGPSPTGGFGLFGIRERLDHLGGRLEIENIPDGGTRVVAVAPLSALPHQEEDRP